MICPACGCDSFQEVYDKETIMIYYKHFHCVACSYEMGVREDKILCGEIRYANHLGMLRIEYPYLNKFVKQYNKKFYNGN